MLPSLQPCVAARMAASGRGFGSDSWKSIRATRGWPYLVSLGFGVTCTSFTDLGRRPVPLARLALVCLCVLLIGSYLSRHLQCPDAIQVSSIALIFLSAFELASWACGCCGFCVRGCCCCSWCCCSAPAPVAAQNQISPAVVTEEQRKQFGWTDIEKGARFVQLVGWGKRAVS